MKNQGKATELPSSPQEKATELPPLPSSQHDYTSPDFEEPEMPPLSPLPVSDEPAEPLEEDFSLPYVIACDYINYRFTKAGRRWPDRPPHIDYEHPNEHCVAMRKLGEIYEEKAGEHLNDLIYSLQIDPGTADKTFEEVAKELFRDGVRWGRIVALFTFGGNLALQCYQKDMPLLVFPIADWVATYIESHLDTWIQQNGTWDAFLRFYDDKLYQNEQPNTLIRVARGLGIACGVGIVTLAAVLAGRS